MNGLQSSNQNELEFAPNVKAHTGKPLVGKKKYDRLHYLKNREILLQRQQKYYLSHKEEILEYGKKHYARNSDKLKKYQEVSRVVRPGYSLCLHARHRAEKSGVPFSIAENDIFFPEKCPLLGIQLERGKKVMGDSSPTLDRIIPSLGYVVGNVWVISQKANRIKNDATFTEFETMYINWKKTIGGSNGNNS
jgi:hypothetical protein